MSFNSKKIIKFLLFFLFFNLNTTCFGNSLPELLGINNYDEWKDLFDLFDEAKVERLKEKVSIVLQTFSGQESRKLANLDFWHVDNILESESETDLEELSSASSDLETEEFSCAFEDFESEEESAIDFNIECNYLLPYIEKYDIGIDELNIIMIGDLHGNFDALNSIIEDLVQRGILTEFLKIAANYKIIGLGDYIDRGQNSLETIFTLMVLKLLNPGRVVLLSGNHENVDMFKHYGFSNELEFKLCDLSTFDFINIINGSFADRFDKCFKLFPSAYFIKTSDGSLFQFNHAGWCNLANFSNFFSSDKMFFKIDNKEKNQLTWSDIKLPNKTLGDRGASVKNYDVSKALEEMKVENVLFRCQGHQHDLSKLSLQELESFSPGFAYIAEDYGVSPLLFVLISGTIKYETSYTAYYPSYLELKLSNEKWGVSGWIKVNQAREFENLSLMGIRFFSSK